MKTILRQSLKTILIIAGLFGVVALVSAWTAPSQLPPGGNVEAPVNVSTNTQTFQGSKTLNFASATNSLYLAGGLGADTFRNYYSAIFADKGGNVAIGTTDISSGKLRIVGDGVVVGNPTGGNKGAGSLNAQQVCIQGNCQSSWPSGGAITPIYKTFSAGSSQTIGNYTFCAITTINFHARGAEAHGFDCYVRKESDGIWRITLNQTGMDRLACSVYCF